MALIAKIYRPLDDRGFSRSLGLASQGQPGKHHRHKIANPSQHSFLLVTEKVKQPLLFTANGKHFNIPAAGCPIRAISTSGILGWMIHEVFTWIIHEAHENDGETLHQRQRRGTG